MPSPKNVSQFIYFHFGNYFYFSNVLLLQRMYAKNSDAKEYTLHGETDEERQQRHAKMVRIHEMLNEIKISQLTIHNAEKDTTSDAYKEDENQVFNN
jgi:hypothetical protein